MGPQPGDIAAMYELGMKYCIDLSITVVSYFVEINVSKLKCVYMLCNEYILCCIRYHELAKLMFLNRNATQ